jgi:hypothetical protein
MGNSSRGFTGNKVLDPHIVILEPEDFKMSLIEDVKGWLKRQDGAV